MRIGELGSLNVTCRTEQIYTTIDSLRRSLFGFIRSGAFESDVADYRHVGITSGRQATRGKSPDILCFPTGSQLATNRHV